MHDTSVSGTPGQGGDGSDVVARDTVFAVASGSGIAGIAVIRISGPWAHQAVRRMVRAELPEPRRCALRTLLDAEGAALDEAVILLFPEGRSYTGEALAELHCHGGRAVVSAVLARLASLPGLRPAEPGEFTRRAFEAGRMDLSEIEGLGDLLVAETEFQRRQAMRLYEGGLSAKVREWRSALIEALALIEVTIDWADEEVPEDTSPEVEALVANVSRDITCTLRLSEGAEKLRSGFEVALVGAPNAGKSSLLNCLAGREAAITSAVPGTTRDVIELRYDLAGLPVTWLDMAGLRETPGDVVETIGVDRARKRAAAADLRIFLDAPDAPLGTLTAGLIGERDLVLQAKCDLSGTEGVSSTTGQGISKTLDEVARTLKAIVGDGGLVTRERQRQALARAAGHLSYGAPDPEIRAEHVRRAIVELDRVLGRVDPESVLDQIFSRFCLGK